MANLLALRKLKQSEAQSAGIGVNKLNAGDDKSISKKRKVEKGPIGAKLGINQIDKTEEDFEEDEASLSLSKKLAKANNFTLQTNMIDVDKHMMGFIETELKKRREALSSSTGSQGEVGSTGDAQDELYAIAEKYRSNTKKYVSWNEVSYVVLMFWKIGRRKHNLIYLYAHVHSRSWSWHRVTFS